MSQYLYQYIHPEYGHLYCGRTSNLNKRIYEHNNCEKDNISREYENLLHESIIFYIKLQNKAQAIAAEAYCIDKYKPFLNKSLKYDDGKSSDPIESMLEMKFPKWEIYNPQNLKLNENLVKINEEQENIIKEISNTENDIRNKKRDLAELKHDLKKLNYEFKIKNNSYEIKKKSFAFDLNEIVWIYSNYDNKNVKFYACTYDISGNILSRGMIYYNKEISEIMVEFYHSNGSKTIDKLHDNNKEIKLMNCIYNSCLLKWYPDLDIYSDIYNILMVKKKIYNTEYNIEDLKYDYDGIDIFSIDKNIIVKFKDGELYEYSIYDESYNNGCDDMYETKHWYSWNLNDGVELYNSGYHAIYKKEDLEEKMKGKILSAKYYLPDKDQEEKFFDEMLSKYNKI